MLNTAIALAATAYSALTDLRTGEVSDRLMHALMAYGVAWNFITQPISQAILTCAIAAVVFALGFLLYVFGQMGGGDAKLFTVLTLLLPKWPGTEIGMGAVVPPYPFIISIFIVSGLLFMSVISFTYLYRILKLKRHIKKFEQKMICGFIYVAILLAFATIWATMARAFLIIAIPMAATCLLIPFKEDAVRLFFARQKSVTRINEEDVIALECIPKSIRKKLGLWRRTLLPHELRRLRQLAKKNGIKTLPVCEELPKYVPYILAALILNLFLGDAFLWLLLNV